MLTATEQRNSNSSSQANKILEVQLLHKYDGIAEGNSAEGNRVGFITCHCKYIAAPIRWNGASSSMNVMCSALFGNVQILFSC